MKQVTFIKRAGGFVLWCLGNYLYQIEAESSKVKLDLVDTSYEDAIILFNNLTNHFVTS